MGWRERLLGPQRVPTPAWDQVRDVAELLRTGEHPDIRRAADSGFGTGYVAGYQGMTPAVPLDPFVNLPPLRTGLSARILGRVAPPPPPQQIRNTLEFLQTGVDPTIRQAGEAGYQTGYVQGAIDRPPRLQVDVLARIRQR